MNRLTGIKARIYFEDEGQDILWWDVDESGIVRACNMQGWVWEGTRIINFNKIDPSWLVGTYPVIEVKNNPDISWLNHRVKKVDLL